MVLGKYGQRRIGQHAQQYRSGSNGASQVDGDHHVHRHGQGQKHRHLSVCPQYRQGRSTSLSNLPDSLGPEIWVTNGQLYESQSKYAKAQENYTKALTVEPTNQAALLSMARLHVRQQQYAEAEQMFVKALAGNPQADVYNELASILQKQGRMAEAQSAVQQAIAAEPSSQRFRNNLAGMLVASGRSDEAVQQLSQVFPPAIASYNVAYLHFANQDLAGGSTVPTNRAASRSEP
ncbi:MAG: tetratricopeptide repeat protein [Pirellulaceae bacterium]